jgi:formylglycine-generating enzyme required for sulfatase activity
MARIPACSFVMGSDGQEGFPEDGEGPARRVTIDAFDISKTTVTNAQFDAFVRASGYVTDAERRGRSYVFWLQLPDKADRLASAGPGIQWWIDVEGASWREPEGRGSSVSGRACHPVVHVSWNDARAYCRWAGTRLPSEAEWECAARGGLHQARYPWGDELPPEGRGRCNIWRGAFPDAPALDWLPGTMQADAFEPNGYGLHNCSGNVWEWCQDAFDPTYHLTTEPVNPRFESADSRRSIRGGSFLCHESYCNRYRVAARSSCTSTSSTSHMGFRVAR